MPLTFTPHDYQELFLADAMAWVASSPSPGAGKLYSSPTGTGKSVMELMALAALPASLIITPKLEIVAGMLQKLGYPSEQLAVSADKLADTALAERIITPIRARNLLARGEFPFAPEVLVVDEAHHDLAETYALIEAYLPHCIRIGLTATPFRGTPRGTADYLKRWGDEVTQVLTLPQAAVRGLFAVPSVEVWPLVDDDRIEVANGEFKGVAATSAVRSTLGALVEQCRTFMMCLDSGYFQEVGNPDAPWDKPTLFAVPTTDNVRDLAERLNAAGLPAAGVTQDTPRKERETLFARCVARKLALVQIDVISEGVDLPIRRLIDLRPTLSPVRWLQQLGRITRPVKSGGSTSEYIVCCRNLERHSYLMEGLLPPIAVATAQKAFPKPTTRAVSRAVGFEGLGRFKPAEITLADGTIGQMLSLYATYRTDACNVDDGTGAVAGVAGGTGFRKVDYAVLLHPCVSAPLVACRESTRNGDGTVAWGRWRRLPDIPVNLSGFQSSTAGDLSDKQRDWWKRAAEPHGLDPTAKVTRRTFACLPVLRDTRTQFRVGGW